MTNQIQTNLLDGIVIFVELVKRGSFTNAALSTNHSTSYISKELSKLEERLGVRLLHRTTRTLSLTPEGKEFFERCQQLVEDAQTAESAVSGGQLEPQGHLKLSCPVSFGLTKLQPILVKFAQKYPKIHLDIDINDRKVNVIEEGFDIVIRTSNSLEDSSLVCRKLCTTYGVTLASPQYLEMYGTPDNPLELAQHKVITYNLSQHPSRWTYIGKDGKALNVNTESSITTNSPQLELAMCLAGQGITRLPKDHISNEVEDGRLVELFKEYPALQIPTYLVYPSKKHLSAKVRHFIDFTVNELSE
ncbi:LysR family transcriptional regulator [Vibrio makurazakiensis]|uniref:LysR family transcriptional regulator n=1 Tax=Vibrio makurazakiensis TaxID=2910250 RepID=UPI003D0C1E06